MNSPHPRLGHWLDAARPKTLPAALAPVLIGLAVSAREDCLALLPAAAIMCCAVLIQIGTNFANDVIDYQRGSDTEERLGPPRAVQSGLVSVRQMWFATAAVLLIALLIGFYLVSLGGWPILLIGLSALTLAILYSATPFALSYTGTAEVFVFFYFGPIASAGTEYILCGAVSYTTLLGGVCCGALSTAILAINNLRDVQTDAKHRKRTLAVRFGERFARREIIGLTLLPALLIGISSGVLIELRSLLFGLFYLAPATVPLRYVARPAQATVLNDALAAAGKTLLVFALSFAIGVLS